MDKIVNEVNALSTDQETEHSNLCLDLFKLVLCHEFAHAMMNTELYGILPSPIFTYSCPVYQFIEEAFANAIALSVVMSSQPKEILSPKGKDFVEKFVKQQKSGYAAGWRLYILYRTSMAVCWMKIKVMFNYKLATHLRDFWKTKDIHELCCKCETNQ